MASYVSNVYRFEVEPCYQLTLYSTVNVLAHYFSKASFAINIALVICCS